MHRILAFLCCLCFTNQIVVAHPGHGSPASQSGVWHYLISPSHCGLLLPFALLAVVGLVFRWRGRMARQRSVESRDNR